MNITKTSKKILTVPAMAVLGASALTLGPAIVPVNAQGSSLISAAEAADVYLPPCNAENDGALGFVDGKEYECVYEEGVGWEWQLNDFSGGIGGSF